MLRSAKKAAPKTPRGPAKGLKRRLQHQGRTKSKRTVRASEVKETVKEAVAVASAAADAADAAAQDTRELHHRQSETQTLQLFEMRSLVSVMNRLRDVESSVRQIEAVAQRLSVLEVGVESALAGQEARLAELESKAGIARTESHPQTPSASGSAPSAAASSTTRDSARAASEAELREYAVWLGLDWDADRDLRWLVRQGFEAPLPAGWTAHLAASGSTYFFNAASGESTWSHPSDAAYVRLAAQEKAKAKAQAKSKAQSHGSPSPRQMAGQQPPQSPQQHKLQQQNGHAPAAGAGAGAGAADPVTPVKARGALNAASNGSAGGVSGGEQKRVASGARSPGRPVSAGKQQQAQQAQPAQQQSTGPARPRRTPDSLARAAAGGAGAGAAAAQPLPLPSVPALSDADCAELVSCLVRETGLVERVEDTRQLNLLVLVAGGVPQALSVLRELAKQHASAASAASAPPSAPSSPGAPAATATAGSSGARDRLRFPSLVHLITDLVSVLAAGQASR